MSRWDMEEQQDVLCGWDGTRMCVLACVRVCVNMCMYICMCVTLHACVCVCKAEPEIKACILFC